MSCIHQNNYKTMKLIEEKIDKLWHKIYDNVEKNVLSYDISLAIEKSIKKFNIINKNDVLSVLNRR